MCMFMCVYAEDVDADISVCVGVWFCIDVCEYACIFVSLCASVCEYECGCGWVRTCVLGVYVYI